SIEKRLPSFPSSCSAKNAISSTLIYGVEMASLRQLQKNQSIEKRLPSFPSSCSAKNAFSSTLIKMTG
ncbi:MAG TPA: hypothetical protein PLU84_04095, partial [Enterococcus aquimarinus]|nr:hypothetical protein [Enterococcus aquimarinus]